jgi:hypothetical protein
VSALLIIPDTLSSGFEHNVLKNSVAMQTDLPGAFSDHRPCSS